MATADFSTIDHFIRNGSILPWRDDRNLGLLHLKYSLNGPGCSNYPILSGLTDLHDSKKYIEKDVGFRGNGEAVGGAALTSFFLFCFLKMSSFSLLSNKVGS